MDKQKYKDISELWQFVKDTLNYQTNDLTHLQMFENCVDMIDELIEQQKPLHIEVGKVYRAKHDIPYATKGSWLESDEWNIISKGNTVKISGTNETSVLLSSFYSPYKNYAMLPVDMITQHNFEEVKDNEL